MQGVGGDVHGGGADGGLGRAVMVGDRPTAGNLQEALRQPCRGRLTTKNKRLGGEELCQVDAFGEACQVGWDDLEVVDAGQELRDC